MLELWTFQIPLLVGLLLLHYLKQLWSHRHYPPGPFELPFFGNMWRFAAQLPHNALMELGKKYGKIYTLWLGPRPMVVLSGFQAVKEGLIGRSEEFSERIETPFLNAVIKGKGILFANGHTWKQQRHFGVVTLRKLGLGRKGMEHHIIEEAQQLVETFAEEKGQPFDPSSPITNSVSKVIRILAFGKQFPKETFQKQVEAIACMVKVISTVSHGLYEIFPSLMKHLPGLHQKAISAMDEAVLFAKKEIQNHKMQQTQYEPQDFIDFYLLQLEKDKDGPNSAYNEDNLAQCVLELMGAGIDTTSTTLKWALLLMVNHPEIQDKVQKEIEDVLSSSCLICYQDRKKLPYTNAVIHEIMRYRHILLFGGSRQTAKDVNMYGFHIPKGTFIVPDLTSVLTDPEQWDTPEEFNPNHFLDKDGQFVTREAFLPFGAGARVCIGEQLAHIEIFIFYTSLLRAFTFQLPEGVERLSEEIVPGLTLYPHPFKFCAIPRCSTS
ncbi:cytochrome P450 2J5-like [Hemicordylus capensis]|uniref:cytochrome P450 2J5-like n=1 Tax=Hemicordylus capensis TaxID=884348 RepID=UPI0023048A7E|nr:cytochrome P450 2J5-like [Hemicordylus capensis]